MTKRFVASPTLLKKLATKRVIIFVLISASYHAQAAPANMGSITVTSSNASTGTASGTYIAAGSGATGSFTLMRNENIGYTSNAEITPANGTRTNGIEIRNNANTSIDRDRFKYTFTITPDDNGSIHTIKIGQASYAQGGNSEIARHTLTYTSNPNLTITPTQATIKNNPSVPYFYDAMGDYFMGSRVSSTQLNSQNAVSDPQLRVDSSNSSGSGLYYYNILSLLGSGNRNSYRPTLSNNQVTLSSTNGVLPPTPTLSNIIKSSSTNPNNQTTYGALSQNTVINSGDTYVSYGIENSQSNYVVAVKNASAVTLTYEGIMNGNIGIAGPVVGETYNEWISFGVESEPLYVFSGTVFNDNGGINDSDANVNKDNAVIDSGIYNNANYFNGVFNPTPASSAEKGITGSTIRLANDCAAPTIEYASKTLTATDASQIGKYEFIILPSAIGNKSSLCIIETSNNNNYPIRTTTDKRVINLTSNNFIYLNNNFGRVIAKNVGLVLEKEQAINDCNVASLIPSASNPSLIYSKSALVDIPAGQCVAYRITATNRTNLVINDFVMQDILQEKGINGAIVTSKLTNPINNASDYAANSVAIGNNGTVETKAFDLAKRTKRSFYFNTKYGSTQSD